MDHGRSSADDGLPMADLLKRLDALERRTVELERLADVLHVGRPATGQPQSTVGLFRLVKGTSEAVRVKVRLGQASVSTIEIVEGLGLGDEVILSDTSAWDAVDRIRLD